MTRLQRTDLPTPHKIELATAAVAQEGMYGSITSLSTDFRATITVTSDLTFKALFRYLKLRVRVRAPVIAVEGCPKGQRARLDCGIAVDK